VKKTPFGQVKPEVLSEVVESMKVESKAKKPKAEKPKAAKVKVAAAEKPITITRVKTVTVEKPVIVRKEVFPEAEVEKIIRKVVGNIKPVRGQIVKQVSVQGPLAEEELALRMIDTYFTEVARYGFKRKLTLDEVVNAYFYSLMRIERKHVELGSMTQRIEKWRS